VNDACGNALTPTGPVVSAIPVGSGTRTYTWTYTDCEGNTHDWVFTYTVTAPGVVMPAAGASTVSCPTATNTVPTPPVIYDQCCVIMPVTGPTITVIPACEGTRTYTWTYTDCGGGTHTWDYVYTVEYNDFTMPANGGTTVNCPALTNTAPTLPTVTDACGNTLTAGAPTISAVPACEGTRTYTYPYTDCEGNTHNWVYTYTVEYDDFTMPANGGTTVSCPTATNTAPTLPTVTDNCGNTLTPGTPTISAIPACEGTRTYTYPYTDCEGNTHNWVYTYTVDVPDFTMPANAGTTVSCPSATNTAPTAPTVTDFCGNTITPSAPVIGPALTCEGTRTYTYTYTDCAGNTHNWVYTYTVEYNDFTLPAAGAATVNCPDETNTVPTPPSVNDACGNALTPTGPVVSAIPVGSGTRTYTWTYTDCEGNTHDWVFTYTVTAPGVVMPAAGASTVSCPTATNTVPTPPVIYDQCCVVMSVTGPTITAIPACEGTRTYTWTYTDCGGGTHTWDYVYTVDMPDFTMPANTGSTVSCPAATNTAPTAPAVTDFCGNNITPSAPVISAIPTCEGTRTYTYTYTDCAGTSHNWVYTYTVEYNDFTMPANGGTTVNCPALTNTAPTLPTVTDACGNTLTAGAPIISAVPACEGTRTYTYPYTDCEGNTHNWVYTYTVEYDDFTMPANGGTTVSCPTATNTVPTLPVVTDNCGNTLTPGTPTISAIPTCEGTRTYTYPYTDCEGNTHNWVYTYTVEYNDFTMPADGGSTVSCPSATNTAPALPTVTDACGNTLTPGTPVISAALSCEGTRTYTYPYTDCEGNTHNWMYTYTVEYNDFTMPANGTSTVSCLAETDVVPAAPAVTDACGNTITPSAPTVNTITSCTEDRIYTFTYTDCEGNTHDWTYTYVINNAAPTITSCPADQTYCATTAGSYTIPAIAATDDCPGTLTYAYAISGATTRTGTGTDASGIFAEGVSTIDWTVTDNCGNVSTCQTTVTIEPLPVVSFSADNLTGCDPTTVNFTDASTGNITIWEWEFGDGSISGLQNPSHTYSSGTYSVTLTVTTAAGCQSTLTMSNYITILANPVASFAANPMVTTEDNPTITFMNQTTGAAQYSWNFGDGSGESTTENPVYTYEGNGEFVITLWVENAAGCSDSTSAVIVIKPTFTFYLANTFTPNKDGRNEMFRPYGIGWDTNNYSMRIYSRWGELVFSTTDVNHGWDGNMPDGSEAQQDVYTVKITIKGLDGVDHDYIQGLGLIR
jgi:gliding motility-associated-like protein